MGAESDVVAVIVDDSMQRHALKVVLSLSGYTQELYESGEAFVQHAAASSAICLLVDVQLGSGSGFDLARQLQEAGFKFPIIFLTANDDLGVARRAIEAGGIGCLHKPLAGKLLMDLLIRSKRG